MNLGNACNFSCTKITGAGFALVIFCISQKEKTSILYSIFEKCLYYKYFFVQAIDMCSIICYNVVV